MKQLISEFPARSKFSVTFYDDKNPAVVGVTVFHVRVNAIRLYDAPLLLQAIQRVCHESPISRPIKNVNTRTCQNNNKVKHFHRAAIILSVRLSICPSGYDAIVGCAKTAERSLLMNLAGADPGICVRGLAPPFLSLPSTHPLPLLCHPPSLRSRAPLNQLGGLGERCKLLQRKRI